MPIHPNVRRCIHILLNTKQCGAPALTGEPYCRFHRELSRRCRDNAVAVPMLQTAADIQLAITDTIRALIEGRIQRAHGTAILYGLQLAQNGVSLGNCGSVKFTGDLEDINPAERSIVAPAIEVRQTIEEFEAAQQAEEDRLAAEAAAEAERAAAQAVHDAEQLAAKEKDEAARLAEEAIAEQKRFAKYAYRAEEHKERKAFYATVQPTAGEMATAEALRRAPKEFLDSIPRDEFGDIHPTTEQQQEIDRMARELSDLTLVQSSG
jgi:hypothetical protein